MGEFSNHISATEGTDAQEHRHLDAPEKRPASGFDNFMKKTRGYVTGGMIALSPVLGSCVGNESTETAEQGGGANEVEQNSESIELKDRSVQLWSNGKNWGFNGTYPKNFRLVVEINGKPVLDEDVVPVNGAFNVKGISVETAQDLAVRAYNSDEIPIELNKKTDGMYGLATLHNPEYPAN